MTARVVYLVPKEKTFEQRAVEAGWSRGLFGWYHVWCWMMAPKFYCSAEELCKGENL